MPIESGLRITIVAASPLPPVASLVLRAAQLPDVREFSFSEADGRPVELPAEIFLETGNRTGVVPVMVEALGFATTVVAAGSGAAALVPGRVVDLVVEIRAGDGGDGGTDGGSDCGDGILQGGEECDDSNQAAGDGCGTQCLFELRDLDGDGHCTASSFAPDVLGLCVDFLDCDDLDPQVHPGVIETCATAGVDNDCDQMDEVDADADGADDRGQGCDSGAPGLCAAGLSECTGATLGCVALASPLPESCNGLDDDCDGAPDEDGDALCPAGHACGGAAGCTCGVGTACSGVEVCCAGACVDPALCGCAGCGPAEGCAPATGVCSCGTTVASGPGVAACPSGSACCGGTGCLPVVDDPANCGGCGMACGVAESCNGAVCACGPDNALATGTLACGAGEACCATGCTALDTDPQNCGGCGLACGAGETCTGGLCRCAPGITASAGAEACPGTPLCCLGQCIACDPLFGTCGAGGGCACAGGLTSCGGTCVDLDLDPLHCGACNSAICTDGEFCSGGQCACRPFLLECPPGSATCVDPLSDALACGSCATTCFFGACSLGSCVFSDCSDAPAPATNCGDGGGAESCVDDSSFASNPLHCGGCGIECQTDEVCTGGTCVDFTVGRTCTMCPCPDCDVAGRTCCLYPGTSDLVICLAAGAPPCPPP